MQATPEWMPADVSEAGALGLAVAPSQIVGIPRLADAPISMECIYDRTIAFSPTGGDFVVGMVVGRDVRDDLLDGGRIVTERLRPLGRLAGPRYTSLGQITELPPLPGG